jgi:CRP-like cAMP-binding protein
MSPMSVNPDQDQHRRNRLLAALRPRDYALLEPHLQIVPIGEGEFLHLPGDEIEQVYFLRRGIVSLMAISKEGDAIATASVGSEGAIGSRKRWSTRRGSPHELRPRTSAAP